MKLVMVCVTILMWFSPTHLEHTKDKQIDRYKCGETIHISNTTKLSLSFVDTHHHHVENRVYLCKFEIWTDPGYLLTAIIHYIPLKSSCNSSYLHIGNDPFRPNTKSITSYMICNASWDLEIVSRDNYLWIVHSHQPDVAPDVAEIHIEVHPPVKCNEFECSPVQCVSSAAVCDGIKDCQNGRDEFCISSRNDSKTDSSSTYDRCFLCDDDTCILPQLPRYHEDWGKNLWYLCDGVWHCKNGTDERMDMCNRIKKSADLLQCVPYNSVLNLNSSVLMWPERKCDGVQDCADNSDEATCSEEKESERIQPVAILLIVFSVLAVVVGFVFCQVRIGKSSSGQGSITQHSHRSEYRRCVRAGSTDLLDRSSLDTVAEEPEITNYTDNE